MATNTDYDQAGILRARSYQLEMLEQSMRRNVIVAMDTGSGKTNIAILRIAAELERCDQEKRVWFLCPKVALAQQQHEVITSQLPSFPTKLLVGSDGCDTWENRHVWDRILLNIRVVICTHQILYDALCHGGVSLSNIALVVFDEAHHCKDNHASNRIMKNFYHPARLSGTSELPHILGLTASPIFNVNASGLQTIEQNLDAICRTPWVHREELLKYVHRPELLLQEYQNITRDYNPQALQTLTSAFHGIDIYQDPYVKFLVESGDTDPEKLHNACINHKTDSQEQIKSLIKTADTVYKELGSWACATYISHCISRLQQNTADVSLLKSSLEEMEAHYIMEFFASLKLDQIPDLEYYGSSTITPKVELLIEIMLAEFELDPEFSCIVFADMRAVVCMLKELLQNHPRTKEHFKIGASVGSSLSTKRKHKISEGVVKDQDEDIEDVLDDLRFERKNLLISTTVVEEGIDISACNNVICFDQPNNLVSFIQRRGRARSSKSKYHMMVTKKGSDANIVEWNKMEEEMKQKYMDEMRELERLDNLERSEEGYREFEVPSTGAKITLDDALQHLHHFCNTLPKLQFASTNPVFIRQEDSTSESFSYRVLLPNSVHSSLRDFESSRKWTSERLAKQDAAFEAYAALYKADLVNDYLLPDTGPAEEDEIYKLAEKRPNMMGAAPLFDPWPTLAKAWLNLDSVQEMLITISNKSEIEMQMRMLLPCQAVELDNFSLHCDDDTVLTVSCSSQGLGDFDRNSISLAEEFTRILLKTTYRSRMRKDDGSFPLLYIPEHGLSSEWICEVSKCFKGSEILDQPHLPHEVGLLRDGNGRPYSFVGVEQNAPISTNDSESATAFRIKAFGFSRRVNYLIPIPKNANRKATVPLLLDPELCSFDHLPLYFSRFAQFIPSIMHKVRNALIVEDLCARLLDSVGFSDRSLVVTAISAPVAQEDDNYQRLEFLGDAMLKYYTSVTLISKHLNFHEGYLAHLKDRIVSNKALSMACKEKGLDQYILRRAFETSKWRPLYNDELLQETKSDQEHELSTKVLADVVEALLGAAYLDGGEEKLLICLNTLLSKTEWLALSHRHHALISAVQPLSPHLPPMVSHLEALTSHTFTHPALALEALTHPSHASTSASAANPLTSIPSYQRLEFLGDAVLDQIVTRMIHSHSQPTYSVFNMHLFRTAAVSKDFLAYLAMTNTISIPTTDVHPPSAPFAPRFPAERPPPSPPPTPSTSTSYIKLNFLSLMRRSPSVEIGRALAATLARLQPLQEGISLALQYGNEYPWTPLVSVAPDKMVSDLIESTLGAIYVDSHGSEKACVAFLEKIGLLPWLRRALREEVKVWHPKEELGVLAARMWEGKYDEGKEKGRMRGEKVIYDVSVLGLKKGKGGKRKEFVVVEEEENPEHADVHDGDESADGMREGKYLCRLSIGGRLIAVTRGVSRFVAETKAADMAVRILREEAGAEVSIETLLEEGSEIVPDIEASGVSEHAGAAKHDEDSDDLMEICQSEFEASRRSSIGILEGDGGRKERSPDSSIDIYSGPEDDRDVERMEEIPPDSPIDLLSEPAQSITEEVYERYEGEVDDKEEAVHSYATSHESRMTSESDRGSSLGMGATVSKAYTCVHDSSWF